MPDISDDHVRLAGILEQLRGRWCFRDLPSETTPVLVDIEATNQKLVLSNRELGSFRAVLPDHQELLHLDQLASSRLLDPEKMAVIILCGGISSRSGGVVHPLYSPAVLGGSGSTLLDLKLRRIAASPLAKATLYLFCSPLNHEPIRKHLQLKPPERSPRLFPGGLVPRMRCEQLARGEPLLYRDPLNRLSFNPAGHFDALRWFVISGALAEVIDKEIILIASYSNWGPLFSPDTLAIAEQARRWASEDESVLLTAEVAPRPASKRSGSLLAHPAAEPDRWVMVKYGYGKGLPALPSRSPVLMSTNTVYISMAGLLKRLSSPGRTTTDLLPAENGQERRAHWFDTAFPVSPVLSLKAVAEGDEVLQAERDLDQLSLSAGPPCSRVVMVEADRAVTLKVPADFEDARKREALLGG